MQVPAGLLVDRYGVRRVVLCSMAASSIGSAAFAFSPGLLPAFFARLLVACGDALVFTSLLKLVALRFPDSRFGLMSGLSQVSGYVGGALATTPLASAVSGFGWRACFLFIAVIGVVNLACGALTIYVEHAAHMQKTIRTLLSATRVSLASPASWGCAMTFASHFAVVTTLSGVWGLPMVAHVFGIKPSHAGTPLLAFMIGNAVGSVALGHAADRVALLDRALMLICLGRMVLIGMLLPPIIRELGFAYVITDFTVLGLVAGGTVPLVLKCTKRLYTAELIGVGASVNTTSAGALAAIAQPVIGIAMVAMSQITDPTNAAGASLNDAGYDVMIGILIILSLLGITGPLLMRKEVRA